MKKTAISLLLITAFLYSCKKTSEKLPNTEIKQSKKVEIKGNWSLFKIKNIKDDKTSNSLIIDSIEVNKKYDGDMSFSEKGFKVYDAVVQYEVIEVKNETFLKYNLQGGVYKLKINAINKTLFSLETTDLASNIITKLYFKKDQ